MREVNLIGGFYQAKSLTFSAQDTVNWLPVPSKSQAARSPIKLRGLPGLKPLFVAPPAPPPSGFVSSTVYPIVDTQELSSSGSVGGGLVFFPIIEAAESLGTIDSGALRTILRDYSWPVQTPEGVEELNSLGTINGGDFRTILRTYANWPDEAMDSSGTINGGEIKAILITYNNWPDEALDSSGTITGGTLT